MSVDMLYGKSPDTIQNTVDSMTCIDSGYLSGADSDSVKISIGNYVILLLFCREITISSGAGSGAQIYMLTKVMTDNTAYASSTVFTSSSNHVTITRGTDDTVTIAPSSTAYDVYYALYAVM